METNAELVRASMRDIAKREEEADIFKYKLRELLKIPMSALVKNKYADAGIRMTQGDLTDAISASLVLQAMNGNIAAYTTIRDTMGYKPVEKVRNDVTVQIKMPDEARELGE